MLAAADGGVEGESACDGIGFCSADSSSLNIISWGGGGPARAVEPPGRRPRCGGYGSARSERETRLFFAGQMVSLLGDAVTPFALAWAVLDLTGSARDLGFVIAAKTAPLVIFLLVGGVFADRLPGAA